MVFQNSWSEPLGMNAILSPAPVFAAPAGAVGAEEVASGELEEELHPARRQPKTTVAMSCLSISESYQVERYSSWIQAPGTL
jgi:hypothetical protein